MTATTWRPSGDIAGLTDHPRLPRLGKIHLGVKETSARTGNLYPKAVDYFVFPVEWRERVEAVYGDRPRELDVVFPTDEVSRVAPVSWKQHTAGRGKVCWGDGTHAVRMIDEDKIVAHPTQADFDAAIVDKDSKRISRREIDCPAKDCVFAKRNACKTVMNVMVMLPKIPGIGVWQLDTGSINSILDVRGGIELVMKLSGGRLAGIPLKLRLEPMEIINPDDQKKKVVYTLKLISPATLGKVLMSGEHNLRELLMADEEEGRRMAIPAAVPAEDVPHPAEPEEDLFPETATGPAAPPIAAAADEEIAIASEIERLFTELGSDAKTRQMMRKAYAGRAKALLEQLRKTAGSKRR